MSDHVMSCRAGRGEAHDVTRSSSEPFVACWVGSWSNNGRGKAQADAAMRQHSCCVDEHPSVISPFFGGGGGVTATYHIEGGPMFPRQI